MNDAVPASGQEPPRDELTMAFSPLHKRAFGMAVGITAASALFLATAWIILRGHPPYLLQSLSYLLPLYDVTWQGAVLGSLSAGLASFCAAWFLAFCRNLVIAISIWLLRTRAELVQTRDFLDHI